MTYFCHILSKKLTYMLYWTTFILIFLSLAYSQEECRVKSVENNRGEKKKKKNLKKLLPRNIPSFSIVCINSESLYY